MTGSKPTTNRIRYDAIQSDSWEGSMDEMKRILGATNPKAVEQAGDAYAAASRKFNATADLLRKHAITIAQVWKGEDAAAAQKQMQRLNATSREIGYKSSQSGYALKDHGEKLQWYKDNAPDEGMFSGIDVGDVKAFAFGGLIGVGAKRAFIGSEEDKAAREHMNRLIGRTVEANSYMPQDITTDLPSPGNDRYTRPPGGVPTGGGGGVGGGPGGGMGSGAGGANLPKDPFGSVGGSAGTGTDPFGKGNPAGAVGEGYPSTPNVPGDPFGTGNGRPGSDLAGSAPPFGSGGGAGAGGLGGDPFGRGGLGSGAGAGLGAGGGAGAGLGGGGLGGAPMGAGGMAGAGPGGPGSPARTGAGSGLGGGSGAGRAGGTGMMGGGAPMGGGGGKGDEEHERTTWLVEDEDVWGANDGDAAPPVIG